MSLLVSGPFDWTTFELSFAKWCARENYSFATVERGIAYAREHYPDGCDLSCRQLADRVQKERE